MIAEATPVSQARLWSRLLAQVWSDQDFKERLLRDPRGVLAEYGIEVPEGVEIDVLEDTASVRHLVLPPPPDDLTDEDLGAKNATYCYSGHCGRCGCGCGRCGCYC